MGVSYSVKTAIGSLIAGLLPQLEQRRNVAIRAHDEKNVIFWLGTARALIAAGRGSELRLWLAMHHVARLAGGPGWVAYDTPSVEQLAAMTGQAVITIRQLLKKQGDGLWKLDGPRVYLVSQAKVSHTLSIDEFEDRCALPAECLAAGLEGFQGFIFAAWVGRRGDRGVMLVWDNLARLWGKSRGQLRRWISDAGVSRTPNRAYQAFPDIPVESLRDLRDVDPEDVGYNHGEFIPYENQSYWVFQRANTLRCSQDYRTAHGGKAVTVNRVKTGRAGQHGSRHTTTTAATRPSSQASSPGGVATPGIEPGLDVHAGQRLNCLDSLDTSRGGLTAALTQIRELLARTHATLRNFRSEKAWRTYRRKHPERDTFLLAWHGVSWGLWNRRRQVKRHRGAVQLWVYRASSEVAL